MHLYLVCPLHSQYMHLLGQAQHKARKLMKGLEHLPHEQRLRGAGNVQLHNRNCWDILPICITTRWEGRKSEKKRKSLFSLIPNDRTRNNRNKWKPICENTCSVWAEEKGFFTLRMVKHWKKYHVGLSVWFNTSVTADMVEDGWKG